jgi:hypothetical protein
VAFSEVDRVLIRKYLGFSSIFLQRDPRLESAITALQSRTDPNATGGSQPDSSEENEAKGLIYGVAAVVGTAGVTAGPTPVASNTLAQPMRRGLLQIEAQIAAMDVFLGTIEVGKGAVRSHQFAERQDLRDEGRRLATQLGRMFDTYPRTDAFSAGPLLEDAQPDYPRSPY